MLILLLTIGAFSGGNRYIVRVFIQNSEQSEYLNQRLTIFNEQEGSIGDYIVDQSALGLLDSLNLKYEKYDYIPEQALSIAELDSFYYTQIEMVDSLNSWAAEYPEIARLDSIGVSQEEHRTIYAMKISDSVSFDDGEPVVLFDGTHHGGEIMGMEICMALIDSLLSGYGRVDSVTQWINNAQIYIVPLVNPDGNYAVHAGISLFYRKNGRNIDNDDSLYEYRCNNSDECFTEGIDLNRNYDWYWDRIGSDIPMHYEYRGDAPNSESEIQAVTSLVARIRPALSISYHSRGEWVYFPGTLGGYNVPDGTIFYGLGTELSTCIGNYRAVGITCERGEGLTWQYGRFGVISFLIETLPITGPAIPHTLIEKNAAISKNIKGAYRLIKRSQQGQICGIVTGSTGNPLQAELRISELYSSQLDPRTSDPLTGRYIRIVNNGTFHLRALNPHYLPSPTYTVRITTPTPYIQNIQLTDLVGDANGSGDFSGLDIVYLVNYLKSNGPAPDPLLLGDVNGDCAVNALDITYLVNYFKGSESEPHSGDCP